MDKPSRFDNFVWNKIGQPKAGPGARSAEGRVPWMGRAIPRRSHAASRAIEVRRFAYLAEREVWTNPLGYSARPVPRPSGHRLRRCSLRHSCLRSRQICLEQNWTAEGWPWSAKRGRVSPMDGTSNPPKIPRRLTRHRSQAFCVSGGERGADEPSSLYGTSCASPFGHRLRRCSLRLPASAVDKIVWNNFGQPKAGPGARRARPR